MTSLYFLVFVFLIAFNESHRSKLLFVMICLSLFSMGQIIPEAWLYSGLAFAANAALCGLAGFCLWGVYTQDSTIKPMSTPIMALLLVCSCSQLAFLTVFFYSSPIQQEYILNLNYYFLNLLTAIELVILASYTDGFTRIYNKLRGYMYSVSHTG